MTFPSENRFFEDFRLGEEIAHPSPRTLGEADATLYLALTGQRFLLQQSLPFARASGLPACPLDDLLVFHAVFGKSVPDISVNAIANLGYAAGRFIGFVHSGTTLRAASRVIGLKETSNGETGIVWVRTIGRDEAGTGVLDFIRWVLVRKRDKDRPCGPAFVPELPHAVGPAELEIPAGLTWAGLDPADTGAVAMFEDLAPGTRIDHVDGMSITEAEHRLATRLYGNTARVHFNDHIERAGRLGACIVYGGHVISVARALSFNGLGNAMRLLAINGGTHCNPCRAGDTVYAWSEVLDRAPIGGRTDAGAVRLRLVATRDRRCGDFPLRDGSGRYHAYVLLDLDYWALLPRRAG